MEEATTTDKASQVIYDPFRAPSVLLYIRACVIWGTRTPLLRRKRDADLPAADIWPTILGITLWATLIVCLDKNIDGLSLSISPNLLTVMGTVCVLLHS